MDKPKLISEQSDTIAHIHTVINTLDVKTKQKSGSNTAHKWQKKEEVIKNIHNDKKITLRCRFFFSRSSQRFVSCDCVNVTCGDYHRWALCVRLGKVATCMSIAFGFFSSSSFLHTFHSLALSLYFTFDIFATQWLCMCLSMSQTDAKPLPFFFFCVWIFH